jgi:hypothetical protein
MFIGAILSIALATPGFIYRIQPQPTPQSTPAQQSTVPCTVTAAGKAPAVQPQVNLSDNTKKLLTQKRQWLQKYSPIVLPDPTKIPAATKQVPAPCPPAQPTTQVAPAPKLPPDVSTTIRCNPLVAPPKGTTGGSTGFTLPDPHQYGVPEQPGQFEADAATPDVAAKTPCYALKVDPKTNKYFIAQ